MKKQYLTIVIYIFVFVLFVTALSYATSIEEKNSVVYGSTNKDNITIQSSIECDKWSGWYDYGSSWCKNGDILCSACYPEPTAGEWQDQTRRRDCWNTETGEEWDDYEWRSIQTGCCGLCIHHIKK